MDGSDGPVGRVVVLLDLDPLLADRLAAVCAQQHCRVQTPGDLEVPAVEGPAAVVAGIPDEAAAGGVRALRARWPEALLVGVAQTPDPAVWRKAQRGGADVVVNRGAAARLLRERLAAGEQGLARRFPLCDAADAAGRLGLVTAVADSPVGPVALYRVDGTLSAVADRCPHAGATLAGGELDGPVLTCPGHGSQFDVRTGERVRGPADDPLRCWRVVEQSGQLWMLLT